MVYRKCSKSIWLSVMGGRDSREVRGVLGSRRVVPLAQP